jgi:S-DNA-T family DNA segregation ATPase FtsK/SpoIIIE
MALALRSMLYLAFGVGAALIAGAHAVTARRQRRRTLDEQAERHAAGRRRVLDEVARARDAELRRLRAQAPDPVRLLAVAEGREPPSWRIGSAVSLRVGVGAVVSRVRLLDDERADAPAPVFAEAPVSVDLLRLGRVSVHGDRGRVLALLSHLVAQVCLKAPDARLGLASTRPQDWEWMGWLPQYQPVPTPPGPTTGPALTTSATPGPSPSAPPILQTTPTPGPSPSAPPILRITPTPPTLQTTPVPPSPPRPLTRPGPTLMIWDRPDKCPPAQGVTTIILGDPDPLADSQIQVSADGRLVLAGAVGSSAGVVTADLPGRWWAQRLARALAGAAGPTAGGSGEIGLADLLGVDPTDPHQIVRRWQTPTTRVPVGSCGDTPISLDLVADGPHLLVAGATGSGKSEFLRTLVMALAMSNPPDRLGFVLIDYKGGAAFAKLAELPHTTGVVTDLDGQLTRRALAGLGVEVRRRERLLSRAGVDDLATYQSLRPEGLPTLARLVIVVDEFRVLAEELPDFVGGLVRLASVGRSLGIHLVLATQRPAGVVGPDIRANVPLRLAFRVTDEIESRDVVGTGLAAALPVDLPGQAVLRRGDEAPVLARFARVDAPPRPRDVTVTASPFVMLGRPTDISVGSGGDEASDPTVLDQLVGACTQAARLGGAARPLGPWLPPLPHSVMLDDLGPPDSGRLRIGLLDLPDEQRQIPLDWDPRSSVLAAVGADEQGAATLVDSLIHGLVGAGSAIHLFDGTSRLVDSRDDPGTIRLAAHVHRDDLEHAGRVLEVLDRSFLDDGPATSSALIVHGWDELADAWSGEPALTEQLVQVVRRGRGRGAPMVFTGGRRLLTGPLATLIDDRLVLRHRDPTDAVLAGAPRTLLPLTWPPGRAVWVAATGAWSVQLAKGPTSPARNAAEVVDPIPAMPPRVRLADLGEPRAQWLPLGVGGTHLRPVGWNTERFSTLLVAGPVRSGRSSCLLALGDSALRLGWTVSVRCTPSSPLTALPAQVGGTADRELMLIDDLECLDPVTLADALADRGGDTLVAAAVAIADLAVRPSARVLAGHGHGLLLGARRGHEGEAFGVRVGPTTTRQPGRGLLVQAGLVTRVQLGLPDRPARDPPSRGPGP